MTTNTTVPATTTTAISEQSIAQTGFTRHQVQLIKATIMSESATDSDLALFGQVCQRTGLDPFSRQIYAIQRKGKWIFQISIDGFRAIADRTGQYAGCDVPTFDEGLSLYQSSQEGRKQPVTATITIYKLVQGQRCSFQATAAWGEYCPYYNGKPGEMWLKMPYLMLAKVAEALALRKAFPSQLSGLYSPEEMQQASAQGIDSARAFAYAESLGIAPSRIKELMLQYSDKQSLFAAFKAEAETEF